MADVDRSFSGSVTSQAVDLSRTFTASLVKKVFDLSRTFTASIDPFGTMDLNNDPIPPTGLSLDPDNLDGVSDL